MNEDDDEEEDDNDDDEEEVVVGLKESRKVGVDKQTIAIIWAAAADIDEDIT
jgi:hypothetical protein